METVRIFAEDNYMVMAAKIFDHFEVGQSCTVFGFVINEETCETFYKYDLVLNEVRRLDEDVNVAKGINGKRNRRRKFLNDSIGGYLAHKIFKFKKMGEDKCNIWRIQ